MLWRTQELSEEWRLKLGNILGRYTGDPMDSIHSISSPKIRNYSEIVIGWTSFWKRLVLPRLWRRPGLRPLRCDGSSLHRWTEPFRTESIRRGHLTCKYERVHLLHHQRQDHQATSQLWLLQHCERHLYPWAWVCRWPLQLPHHQADLPASPGSHLPQSAGHRLRLGNPGLRRVLSVHSPWGWRHCVRRRQLRRDEPVHDPRHAVCRSHGGRQGCLPRRQWWSSLHLRPCQQQCKDSDRSCQLGLWLCEPRPARNLRRSLLLPRLDRFPDPWYEHLWTSN